MCLKLAALWQGGLVAALGTVAEDADFRLRVTRTKSAEISRANPCHRREEAAAFFKELLGDVIPLNELGLPMLRNNVFSIISKEQSVPLPP